FTRNGPRGPFPGGFMIDKRRAITVVAIAAALTGFISLGVLPNPASARQTKPPVAGGGKAGGKGGARKNNRAAERQMARLEKIVGHPLSVTEKAQVVAAYLKKQAADKATNETFMA